MNIDNITKKVDDIADGISTFKDQYNNDNQLIQKQINELYKVVERPSIGVNSLLHEKSDFSNYLRKEGANNLNIKSFSSNEEEGGATISSTLSTNIINQIYSLSPIRRIASIEKISSNALDIILEEGELAAGWVQEVEERKATDTTKLKQKRISVHELYSCPIATKNLIDDSMIDLASWLMGRLVDRFSFLENHAFINGDGENKPKGILSANTNIETIEVTEKAKIQLQDILKLINSLDDCYLPNATFLMNRATLSQIQTIQDQTGRFIWQPSYNKEKENLFGIPVLCCNHMPKAEEGALAIALGDFKLGYKIVDRSDINIVRDHYTNPPFIRFHATKRVGGDVINSKSIKLLKL